jgi:ATP-binding cassette subfamily B protein
MAHERPGSSEGSDGRRAHLGAVLDLLPFLWPAGRVDLRARVVLAVVFLVGAKVVSVAVPILLGRLIDRLSTTTEQLLAVPVVLIASYGIARVTSQALGELRDAVFIHVAQHAIRAVALTMFEHLHGLSLRFHLERQTGGLSRIIERGTKSIQFVLNFSLFHVFPTLFEIALVSVILLDRYDSSIAAITFVCITAYIAFTLIFTEWRTKFRRAMNKADNEAMTKAIDSLLNYETVKYFGNEPHEARRFDRSLEHYQRAAVTANATLSYLNIGQGAIIGLGLIGVMLIAANGVVGGSMSVGDFAAVNGFLIQLYLPLGFLGFVYREMKQSLVDMEKLFDLRDVAPEVTDRPGAPALLAAGGDVVFDNVSFHYDPRRPILENVSFRARPGSTVAIVGPSGAGKSTISRLLFRFYDVTAGRILLDGQDVRDVTQASVRRAIGVVPQDTVLFNDTVRYNIRYGRPDASDAEIEEAARLASIHAFIATTPDRYDTLVGERGLKISGGEKQRVAIARTVLKRPLIFLFDEATSALDSKTEKAIQRSLREVSTNRTTIMIAHRLSTVVHADEILVLDHGRIIERGRHADLLARGGQYAAMWARQQEAEAHDDAPAAASAEAELVPLRAAGSD